VSQARLRAGGSNCRLRAFGATIARCPPQIEEAFRDLKNHRWGHALRYAQSANTERLAILLLLAHLANFVLWLAGIAARARGWPRHFQANTEKRRDVLSIPFLGNAVGNNPKFRLKPTDLGSALPKLFGLVRTQAEYA